MLSWKELQEVILDVKVTLNDRDAQLPILIPNALIHIQHIMLPDLQTHNKIVRLPMGNGYKVIGRLDNF